ncbi:hypothetical protein [Ekhidna sp.]|uniref:hypothetical protein n=1 Tax=Ekhidna sp. TaxID=2608089 RepID=UPI003BAB62CE
MQKVLEIDCLNDMISEIGGYFELELKKREALYGNLTKLNSGRHAFEYILQSLGVKKILLPAYSCPVLLQPLNRLKIPFDFYSIDRNFKPLLNRKPEPNEYLLYSNFFGICGRVCSDLSTTYKGHLILDFAQAFYNEPLIDTPVFYSPRKFFGLPDGGLTNVIDSKIELDNSYSHNRISHLISRIDCGAESGYQNFKSNEESIDNSIMLKMSKLTERLYSQIDFNSGLEIRNQNFSFLSKHLNDINEISFAGKFNAPLCYPLLIPNGEKFRKELIKRKIFIPTYWPGIDERFNKEQFEKKLLNDLLCLPIDQRYGRMEMEFIIENLFSVGKFK